MSTIYPLSPLQQGMLYHALAEPHTGVDIEQLVFTFSHAVDPARLQAAWAEVVARHDILRTAFRWDGAEPKQEVHPEVSLVFTIESRELSAADWTQWLKEDRRRGFAMDTAPLLRFHFFDHGADGGRLVWTFHHALLDGRSFPLLIDEAFTLYDHPETPLPSPPRPYGEFIEWHCQQDPNRSEAYWRAQLKGFRAPTPLPIEGLGTLTSECDQADAEVSLSNEATAELRRLAESEGVTLNTLVQAAWAILLHRYSGDEDVCFGATRAGRHATVEGADAMVGLFINTVPVRAAVSDERPLTGLWQELRTSWVEVRPHEHTPLARVQAWSEAPPGQALFRTLVVFENYDLASHFQDRGGVWAKRRIRLHEQTNFPICLAAYAGERLRLVAEFDRSRLDPTLVQALLGHVRTLLEAMPAHATGTIGDLPIASPEEAAQWIKPPLEDAPSETSLHARFSQRAAETPDAIALVQGNTRLTYAELDARANAVAAYLIEVGVGREAIVGLCLERTPELVIALLGILKANAAYLPIDLAYPPERLAFMLADAQAPVLLTQRHLAGRLPAGHGARLVFIEDIALTAPASAKTGGPDQLCYVLYTSGSTGQPKGCCITHRNVVRLFTATEPWLGFDSRDIWTLFHSTAFDFSVWELWGALLYGGTLVVVPFEISRSPEQFRELLARERVTVLNQTPSAFRQLMAADAAATSPLTLRTVIFGGEALEMRSLAPWFARHGDTKPQLVNMYGITETTVHVTYRPLSAGDITRGSVIGAPIPDLELLVLDARQRPVPIGIPGELFVGGAGLARGYHQRPELTAARFMAHPYRPGARLYRTGDLARVLPDGDVEYLGRIDQQVKIRGFRIELGEIESVLLRHPRVREAVVLPRDDGHGGKRLVAWIVEPAPGDDALSSELRAHLQKFVPDYMVPAAFVRMERLPLTTNGKLDTKALPEPASERPASTAWAAPSTPSEHALAEIWQRVLKLDRVGVHDNFFELGGDSILTILVVSQARQRGLALTPKQVFDTPTIAQLAAGASSSLAPALLDKPASGPVPLTPIQRWFFAQKFAQPHHWNQSLTLQVNGEVSTAQLVESFHQVLTAHPVFRLRYRETTAGWEQFFGNLPPVENLTGQDSAADLQGTLRLNGPLVRFVYHEAERQLTIAMHHLLVDGVSWRIFLEDLEAALHGKTLSAPTTGFHTWAHTLAGIRFPDADANHWQAIPSSQPLPRDFASGENTEAFSRTVTVQLEAAATEILLRDLPTQESLLAALAHALAEFTGQREHIIELEGHGREETIVQTLAGSASAADLSHTIGWFTTIYPLRLRAKSGLADTLTEVSQILRSVPHRGLGAMGISHAARGEVLFNYLGQFDQITAGLEHFHLSEFRTEGWHGPANQRTHVLEINCLVLHGRLEIRITYSAGLHQPARMESFASAFRSALLGLLTTPARFPLAKLDAPALHQIATRYPALTDLYPLSPMQRLFFALETARPGSGSDQWHGRIRGPVSAANFHAAWRQIIARHATLRSVYLAGDLPEPRQAVLAEAAPAWHFADLRAMAPAQREPAIQSYLAADAGKPFVLTQAPLTRLALFRLADDEHCFVWTHHHLEIDGWSWPLVFDELHALLENEPLPAAPRYRDYVAWLDGQRDDSDFWRAHLQGFHEITRLPLAPKGQSPAGEHTVAFSEAETAALQGFARQLQVTLNVLVQAAWALLLGHHGSHAEIVFGAAFSGRPAELPGSDRMIGHFVNNLPVRVPLFAPTTVSDLAQRLHRQLGHLAEHQHAPLPRIEACSELPWTARLFSTLVVFQNYLGSKLRLGAARLEDLHAPVRTNYPLTLVINPGPSLTLTMVAQPDIADAPALAALGGQLTILLRAFRPTATIAELQALLPPAAAWSATAAANAAIHREENTTELERTIAELWREAFGRDVSVEENFFDLGGHSLLMLRVHARLSAKLAREIPVVKLFQHPTIRSLSRALGDTEPAGPSAAITAAQNRAAKARVALARRPLHSRPT